jgi:amino-acid N-acetyltransferase
MSTTTTSDAILRPARGNDLPAIEHLLVDAGLPLEGVSASLDTFTVAESGRAIVGVGGLELCGDDALLRSVAVAPEWRSRGLGRMLVTHLIADARSRGLHGLYLLTTTAERYFPSFGFVRIERTAAPAAVRETEEFRDACPASAVAMARVLREG